MNVYLRFTKLKNLKNTVHISIIIVSGLAFLFNAKYLSASAAFLACVSIVLDLCLSRRIRKDFDHLYRMAYFDSLTGIPSRTSADMYIAECTDPQAVSIVIADLDGLKMINDTYGHQTGDILIRDFAFSFSEAAFSLGFAARNGGDEFLAIFQGTDSAKRAEIFCQKLKESIDRRNNFSEHSISYSIGFASGKDLQNASVSEIISHADACMYQQKQGKKSPRETSDGRNLCEINQHTR